MPKTQEEFAEQERQDQEMVENTKDVLLSIFEEDYPAGSFLTRRELTEAFVKSPVYSFWWKLVGNLFGVPNNQHIRYYVRKALAELVQEGKVYSPRKGYYGLSHTDSA